MATTVSEQVEHIPIGDVKPSPDNPRKKVGDVVELATSIKEVGVLEPLIATRSNGGYELVAGARRLAAAELAGETTVPVIVRDYSPAERALAMAIENLQREDLTPLEEAGAYQRLLDELQVTQRELAPRVGKTQSHISKRLALLELPKDVQAKVDSGGITIADALELSKLAEHPDRLKKALTGPGYYDLETRIRMELAEVEQEKKIAKLEQEYESRGLATVRVGSEWNLPKGVHRLKGGNAGDPQALQITAKQHETESCHAIAITKQGLGFPVCTDRKQHPKVKTKQEADRGTTTAARGSTGFKPPKEDPATKKLRAAQTSRHQLVQTLVAKKPPKEALTLALRVFVLQEIELCYGERWLEIAARWLGLLEPTEDPTAEAEVDVQPLLIEFAARGDAELQRTALAFVAANIDHSEGSNDVNAFLRGQSIRGANLKVSAYLEFLRSQGHELSDLETKRLDGGAGAAGLQAAA